MMSDCAGLARIVRNNEVGQLANQLTKSLVVVGGDHRKDEREEKLV